MAKLSNIFLDKFDKSLIDMTTNEVQIIFIT